MSFVQQVLKDLGKQPVKPTAWARDGLNIGTPVTKPSPGDLVIVEGRGWAYRFLYRGI